MILIGVWMVNNLPGGTILHQTACIRQVRRAKRRWGE
jgi:hypothetical protein